MGSLSSKKPGPLTYALITLVVLFAAGDAFAELKGDGRSGVYGETVSTFIHQLEAKAWPLRIVAGLITGWLFLHLTFNVP